MAGPQYASAVLWTVGALVLLVIVLFLVRLVRGSSGAFVAGGRNRRARLAIMDAAAVDNQRRLVLVRRDDVEHLILIGGPTDVVVEQNIVPGAALHRQPNRTESDSPNGRASMPTPEPTAERPDATRRERQEPLVTEPRAPRAPEISSAKAERPEPVLASEPQAPVSARPDAEPSAAPSGSVHFLDKTRSGPARQAAGATAVVFPVSGIEADERRAPAITMPEREASAPEIVRDENARKVESLRREPHGGIDAALSEELKEPLLAGNAESRQNAEPSLEEEMKRLLGELSMPARN